MELITSRRKGLSPDQAELEVMQQATSLITSRLLNALGDIDQNPHRAIEELMEAGNEIDWVKDKLVDFLRSR